MAYLKMVICKLISILKNTPLPLSRGELIILIYFILNLDTNEKYIDMPYLPFDIKQ
jgi:hypothetical protein